MWGRTLISALCPPGAPFSANNDFVEINLRQQPIAEATSGDVDIEDVVNQVTQP